MLCLEDRITIGNPIPVAGAPKISVVADLRTEHATIEFNDSSYWLTDDKSVAFEGDENSGRRSLSHGTMISVGQSLENEVQIRFEQPSSLSLTSTLQIESGHRFADGVDGVVLFRKTCLLGAGKQKHIQCGGWSEDVIFFERDSQLFCKSTESLITLDGVPSERIVKIHNGAHLAGEDWSMRVEAT
ncbi:hypothetical protein Mal48_19890 [Thalassoglobus polymorphus]|uniref:FHA domain-containing protein n=2 Tax=Thalassoglobus polymorphus TaxID=2527994 RepID=A0A517QM70_9PLAN|nr:hypothetical protein Mal48_19890 [Thalassoglobus polymorphus]